MIALLDTNVLLHYDFHGADWAQILGGGSHQIVTCWVNVQELDRLKNDHSKRRRRDRSRKVLGMIEEAAISPLRLPSSSESDHLLVFSSARPDIDFDGEELDQSIPDHRLVATAIALRDANPDDTVVLITDDVTPRIAAKRVGIEARPMPRSWQLPPSEDVAEKELRQLREQLQRLQNRQPQLAVSFGSENTLEVEWSDGPIRLDEDFVRQVSKIMKERFPLPLDRYRNRDPSTIPASVSQDQVRWLRYFERLESWIGELDKYFEASADLLQLDFHIHNHGSTPATDVDVQFSFPSHLALLNVATGPKPPEPPVRPGASKGGTDAAMLSGLNRLYPYGWWVKGRNASPVVVGTDDTGTPIARVRLNKIPQGRTVEIDPIWVRVGDAATDSVGITAILLCDELPQEVEQGLHVTLTRTDEEGEVSPEDFVELLGRI